MQNAAAMATLPFIIHCFQNGPLSKTSQGNPGTSLESSLSRSVQTYIAGPFVTI